MLGARNQETHQMSATITIDVASAEQDSLSRVAALEDPIDYTAHINNTVTAKYIGKPLLQELYALLNSRLQGTTWCRSFTCQAADAIGDPVKIVTNDEVTKALATTVANAKVIGFIRHKGALGAASVPASTTCWLDHFRYATGLSGGTAGNPIYLSDTGTFAAAAGTVKKIVGVFLSATTGYVVAIPELPHASEHITGGVDVIDSASATAAGLSPAVTAPSAGLLSVLGVANGETVRTDKVIFDTSNPAALGTAGPGTQIVAARRDHVHAMPTSANVIQYFDQANEPTSGQLASGLIAIWTDTDDGKCYLCYAHGSTIKTVELT
jgi:hypothetical protein